MSDNEVSRASGRETNKRKIVKAASRLFEEKGLQETSVGEIAEKAGVSVPEAYSYMRRKSEILFLIMEDLTGGFQEAVRPNIAHLENPKEKLLAAMRLFFFSTADSASQTFLLYRESKSLDAEGRARIMTAEENIVNTFKEILDQGVSQGVFKAHDTQTMAYNIVLLGHAWVLKRWHYKKRLSLEDYFQVQSEFILSAVSPPTGS